MGQHFVHPGYSCSLVNETEIKERIMRDVLTQYDSWRANPVGRVVHRLQSVNSSVGNAQLTDT